MLVRVILALVLVAVIAFGGFFAWAWRGEIPPVQVASPSSFDPAVVAKGSNLAAIGSCVVCHTQAGGAAYAGGFPIETPFGTIFGTNITPDERTGIGSWSQDAFRRAMREGVSRKGEHLYPAFPYEHFTRATDADIDAIYAFLMTRDPVPQSNRAPELPFPLNIRLAAAAWKLLFLRGGEFQADPAKPPEWNRGAYLAETFGHCGSCHTPRNELGAEQRDQAYAGGVGEDWHAPALTEASPSPAPWTVEAVYNYLRHGFDAHHGRASGPMRPVVDDLARAADNDVRAIATYIASLSGADDQEKARRADAVLAAARERTPAIENLGGLGGRAETTGSGGNANDGATIFAGACASCHHRGGQTPAVRPADLALSDSVNAPDPGNLLHIILTGIQPRARERGVIMPGFDGALTDQQIAAVAAYVRTQFSPGKPQWADIEGRLAQARRKTGS